MGGTATWVDGGGEKFSGVDKGGESRTNGRPFSRASSRVDRRAGAFVMAETRLANSWPTLELPSPFV